MFSIGEFARLGAVSIRTLRHYDEIGLLRPAKVDPATGYRGYSAERLARLNRIMAMKELGLTLIQARRLLDGVTPDELRGMLILRPEIEAAVAVRNGPAASIFPMVYHDLVRWIEERGYQAAAGPGREVWAHEVDDIADVAQQVTEIQLPFTRPAPSEP